MNWLKWTASRGWQVLRGALHGTDQDAEMARLVGGIDLVKRADDLVRSKIYEAPDDRRCPCCTGSHCLVWRQSGHSSGCGGHTEEDKCWRSDEDGLRLDGCGGEAEPVPAGVSFRQLMDATFVRPGRHTVRYLVDHWVPWTWNPIPLRTRVMLWPAHYAAKLGRPVQIGLSRYRVVMP